MARPWDLVNIFCLQCAIYFLLKLLTKLWPQLFNSGSNKWLLICQAVTLWINQILLPVGHHFNSGIMMFVQPRALLFGETLGHA